MGDVVPAAAVLTAAGSGARLGSPLPKALVELGGVPLVVRAAQRLADSGTVARVVVTAPPGAVDAMTTALAPVRATVPVDVVVGGPSRQASVAAGLAALDDGGLGEDGVVLVHDAARPLVPLEVVRRVVAAVRSGHDAVIPGLPVTDTIKQVADFGAAGLAEVDDAAGVHRVTATHDRRYLRAVQTPQGFTLAVLRRAHTEAAARAADERTAATDDAALVEALGLPVWLVDGHEDALKITTRRDLAVAELLLRGL